MASEQATRVHRLLRDQRSHASAGTSTPPSRTQQRALAERQGDSTAEPTGVMFDDVVAGSVEYKEAVEAVREGRADPYEVAEALLESS